MLNCAVYMLEERAPDDPWDALKRLLRANMAQPVTDIASIAKGSGLLVKGIGRRILQSNAIPQTVTRSLIDTVIRFNANFAANEYQSRGLPHKLTGLHLDAISEQEPDPESRITLSEEKDALGIPLACVNWRIDNTARWSLLRLGELIAAEFPRVGLPSPELEHWIVKKRPQDSVIIDMAHSLGTTRMSDDPKQGVVDTKCRVHDVAGLYVAGGSIFPTSGHANPTLTILALAIRLADQIKLDLNSCRVHAPVSVSLSNASN